MGVANIHNCKPKDTTNVRSLYLVVNEEIKIPKPKPNKAICISIRGTNIKLKLGFMFAPLIKKYE